MVTKEKTRIMRFTAIPMAASLMNPRIFTASLTREMISPVFMVSKKRWGRLNRWR